MKILLLILGVVAVAGVVAWSFAVLPDQSKQDKLGASLITADDEPIAADTKPAEINASAEAVIPILLEPLQVKAGNEIKVTVGVSLNEVPIFWLVDIYLESSTGLTSAKGSILNIDGEGRRFGSINIPEDAEPGIWKVKTVEITDTEGTITSYSYGKEIFSTFTVVAP